MKKQKKESLGVTHKDIVFVKIAAALLVCVLTILSFGKTGNWGEAGIIRIKWLAMPAFVLPVRALFQMPETVVYMLFGLLHAIIAHKGDRQKYSDLPTTHFLADWFLFSSFYRLVLLPACGWGYLEWIALACLLACEFGFIAQSKIIQKPNFNDKSLIAFGVFLWLIKLIARYLFPNNLSSEIIGNNTAMNLAALLIAGTAVFWLKKAFKSLSLTRQSKLITDENTNRLIDSKNSSVGNAVIQTFSSLIKALTSLVTTVITNPLLLLAILGGLLLLGIGSILAMGFVVTGWISNVRNDIIRLLVPLLQIALQSDNPAYADDLLNTIGTVFAMIAFITVTVWETNTMTAIKIDKDEENKAIEETEKKKQELLDIYTRESMRQIEQSAANDSINVNFTKQASVDAVTVKVE